MESKPTKKYELACNTLPTKLQPIFDKFVDDYMAAGVKRYGKPFVS